MPKNALIKYIEFATLPCLEIVNTINFTNENLFRGLS